MKYNKNHLTYKPIFTKKEIENPYDKALYLHNNLAYLQYFIDVNKRTARLMMNVSLKAEGKMILIPRDKYYEEGSYNLSKEFMLKSYQFVADFMERK